MNCINCNNPEFYIKEMSMRTLFKHKQIEVIAEAFACSKCHHIMMSPEQMANFQTLAANTYEKQYGVKKNEKT